MKKTITSILIFISLIIPYNIYALSTTEANEKIDINKDCSLILNYYYDNNDFDNTKVKIYHIADVTSDFQYQLSSDFSNYPIKINGLKANAEWQSIEQTLNAYIEADHINEKLLYSIKDDKVIVSDLKPGLYFIKTDKINTEDYTLLFDSFLISVPELISDGTWNYDVNTYPKAEEYFPKYDEITYTVIKEWIDNKNTRPNSIDIELYKDGNLVEKQTLSSTNNWTYQWITDDDGSSWTVVERNIPKGYNVTIQHKNKNFIIVNKDSNYKEENPKTGDNINLYLYLFIGSSIGLILLVISFIINKKHV